MRKGLFYLIIAVLLLGGIWAYDSQFRGTSQTPEAAVEKVRGERYISRVLWEMDRSSGKIVFYAHRMNDGEYGINAEYVQKRWSGWIWRYGGGHTESGLSLDSTAARRNGIAGFTIQDIPNPGTRKLSDSPFPLLFGVIQDPDVSILRIISTSTGKVFSANDRAIGNGYRLWYAFPGNDQGTSFTVQSFDAQGRMIAERKDDLRAGFSSGTGIKGTD